MCTYCVWASSRSVALLCAVARALGNLWFAQSIFSFIFPPESFAAFLLVLFNYFGRICGFRKFLRVVRLFVCGILCSFALDSIYSQRKTARSKRGARACGCGCKLFSACKCADSASRPFKIWITCAVSIFCSFFCLLRRHLCCLCSMGLCTPHTTRISTTWSKRIGKDYQHRREQMRKQMHDPSVCERIFLTIIKFAAVFITIIIWHFVLAALHKHKHIEPQQSTIKTWKYFCEITKNGRLWMWFGWVAWHLMRTDRGNTKPSPCAIPANDCIVLAVLTCIISIQFQ